MVEHLIHSAVEKLLYSDVAKSMMTIDCEGID